MYVAKGEWVMGKGQLQEKMKQYADQWVGVFYGRLSDEEIKRWFNEKGRKMETDRDNIMKDVKQAIGEMRKDFPKWYLYKGTICLQKELTDEQLKEATFYSAGVDQREFTKWFVKWLGEDEQ